MEDKRRRCVFLAIVATNLDIVGLGRTRVDGNLRTRIGPYADIRGCPYLLFRRYGVSVNVRGRPLAFSPLAPKVAAD